MCIVISMLFYIATYFFYSKGLVPQALMSATLASIMLIFFIVRMYKNRRCIFGKDDDCNGDNIIRYKKK